MTAGCHLAGYQSKKKISRQFNQILAVLLCTVGSSKHLSLTGCIRTLTSLGIDLMQKFLPDILLDINTDGIKKVFTELIDAQLSRGTLDDAG